MAVILDQHYIWVVDGIKEKQNTYCSTPQVTGIFFKQRRSYDIGLFVLSLLISYIGNEKNLPMAKTDGI